jgi:rhodanese-related sulfurtransferase
MVRTVASAGLGRPGAGYSFWAMAEDAEKVQVDAAREEIARGDAVAVDVRSEEEWGKGHVPGALHLPDGEERAQDDRLEEGARLMVIAKNGKLAVRAAKDLNERGYDAVAVDGGMDDWASNFNTQPTEDPDEDTELGLG